ncbi:MAG TPA: LamG domain-containing protein, partial [Thermoanaerobaculia bacterium]
HPYTEPGTYAVSATGDGGGEPRRSPLRGLVVVEEARPPRVAGHELREGGRELRVSFDEPVERGEGFAAALGSGLAVTGTRLDAGGRVLVVELAETLVRPDRLTLRGVVDRAQRPNRMPEATLDVAPPAWPATRDDLVFLWRTGNSPNLVHDPEAGADRTYTLESLGRAHLDHHFRMRLGDGAFAAPEEAAERLLEAAKASNELTLEATLTPRDAAVEGLRRIVTFSSGESRRNFTLGQEGRNLVLRLRTGPTGPNADRPQVTLWVLEPGRTEHVVVTYTPGRLRVYRNGEPAVETGDVRGSFGMHWRSGRLVFGDEWGGGGAWPGTLEGVAIYSRALAPETAREGWLRYRRLLEARPEVPRTVVRARLAGVSKIPTLSEISPYRQALALYEYEVLEALRGRPAGSRVRVARWVILDGDTLPEARLRPGHEERLTLEPFTANPQLEGVLLSDTPGRDGQGPLYYLVEP